MRYVSEWRTGEAPYLYSNKVHRAPITVDLLLL